MTSIRIAPALSLGAMLALGSAAIGCSSQTGKSTALQGDAQRTTGSGADPMSTTTEPICRPQIAAAGLPGRTERILKRERDAFEGIAQGLVSTGKGGSGSPTVTPSVLRNALASRDPVAPYAAAFVIGRCTTGNPDADRGMIDEVRATLAKQPPADVRIELAMALALHGEVEPARRLLSEAVAAKDPLGQQYMAAFYLAQLGDPSGWPAMVKALTGDLVQFRGMATRHVIGFLPYDGTEVGGQKIDVRGALAARLQDPEEMVRQEVPLYLEELAPSNLRALLEPVAARDPSPTVRAAAQLVLDRNR
jgi:hypothetical protein